MDPDSMNVKVEDPRITAAVRRARTASIPAGAAPCRMTGATGPVR